MGNTLPLEGIRVIDFGTHAAAPICGMALADWGADVIKIETMTGEFMRVFGLIMQCPVGENDDIQFELDNRNKRGMAINMKSEDGRKIISKLLATADVMITNFRVKALQNLGLDYETLSRKYPRLVYAYLNGYGDSGPDKDKPGFDLSAYFARCGILVEMREPGGPLVPPLAGFGDHPTGTYLAGGICAALVQRSKTGKGCKVQNSLVNTALWNLQLNIAAANNNAHLSVEDYEMKLKPSRKKPRQALMNTYRAGDGRWITVMSLEYDRYWKVFAEKVIMRPDLVDDPRFNNQAAGFQNAAELAAIIEEEFAKYDGDELLARLKAGDVPHEKNLYWREIKDDVHIRENGFIMEYRMRSGRNEWIIGNPVRFNREKTVVRRGAPKLGEHNSEILAELGYSPEEIASLRDAKVIK